MQTCLATFTILLISVLVLYRIYHVFKLFKYKKMRTPVSVPTYIYFLIQADPLTLSSLLYKGKHCPPSITHSFEPRAPTQQQKKKGGANAYPSIMLPKFKIRYKPYLMDINLSFICIIP